jgi:hypothetical protein
VGLCESDDEHHRYGSSLNKLINAHKKAAFRRLF